MVNERVPNGLHRRPRYSRESGGSAWNKEGWIPAGAGMTVKSGLLRRVGNGGAGGLDLGRLGFDQPDDMVDHLLVADMMVGQAGEIDHMLALAAAGNADVGLARLARTVDDAAQHRQRH